MRVMLERASVRCSDARQCEKRERGAAYSATLFDGLTPELSRAEGVGLNEWLGLIRCKAYSPRAH